MFGIASYNKRPMTQGSRSYMLKTGEAAWGRDVYHLTNNANNFDPDGRTLCGRKTYGWASAFEIDEPDHNCCSRCAAKA